MATHFVRGGRFSSARRSRGQDFQSLASLTEEFLTSASDLSTAILDQTTRAFGLPGTSGNWFEAWRRTRVCHVPKRACHDPFLGEVIQTARVGETLLIPFRFRNGTKRARVYTLTPPLPLRNVQGETAGSLILQPLQLALSSMQTGLIEARVVVDNKFQPGFEYKTDLVIKSQHCDDQLIGFILRVLSQDTGPLIALGCPCSTPAHRVQWYHHSFCDEPRKEDTAPGPTPPAESAGGPAGGGEIK